MTDNSLLISYLNLFAQQEKNHPGSVSDCVFFDFKKHTGHIVFSFLIHGNEVGPLEAALKMIQQLKEKKINYGGKVSFVLGNKKAALQGQRFLDADLNRSFGLHTPDPNAHEHKRAAEMTPLIEQCDVFFDFHQTIMPCAFAFYIFPMHTPSQLWAQAAGGTTAWVTRKASQSFSSAGHCADEWARTLGKPGVTIELGQQGFNQNCTQTAFLVLKRTLSNADAVYAKHRKIELLAKKQNPFSLFTTKHREPLDHPRKRLNPNFKNFDLVQKGAVLGADGLDNPLVCPCNGYILFPKYPTRDHNHAVTGVAPGELFLIVGRGF